MKKLGVANTLTIFRIVCIPIFVLFYSLNEYFVALLVFAIAGFTDLIDGTIARLRKENSPLGALLDPIADKGLMFATFIALAITEIVPWWFIYIILSRDLVVLAGFIFIHVKKIKYNIKAIFSSKVATLCEILAGTLALIYMAFPQATIGAYPIGDLVYGLILIASVLILVATLQYLKLGIGLIDEQTLKRRRRKRAAKKAKA